MLFKSSLANEAWYETTGYTMDHIQHAHAHCKWDGMPGRLNSLWFSCRRVSDESKVLWRICSRDDQRIDIDTHIHGQFGEVICSINTFETCDPPPLCHLWGKPPHQHDSFFPGLKKECELCFSSHSLCFISVIMSKCEFLQTDGAIEKRWLCFSLRGADVKVFDFWEC